MYRTDENNYHEESQKSLFSKVKDFLMKDEQAELIDGEATDDPSSTVIRYPEPEPTAIKPKNKRPVVEGGNNVVNIRDHFNGVQTEMVIAHPRDLEGAASICTDLCNNTASVFSLQGLDYDVAQRILDFVSGGIFSVNGNIERVSNEIFVAAPASVNISTAVKKELKKSGKSFFKFTSGSM
jgi:cell division inhibitor SepF